MTLKLPKRLSATTKLYAINYNQTVKFKNVQNGKTTKAQNFIH